MPNKNRNEPLDAHPPDYIKEIVALVYRPALDNPGSGVPNGVAYLDSERFYYVLTDDDFLVTPDGSGGAALISSMKCLDDTLIVAKHLPSKRTGLLPFAVINDPLLKYGGYLHIQNIRDGTVTMKNSKWQSDPNFFTVYKKNDEGEWELENFPRDSTTPLVMKEGEEWLTFNGNSDGKGAGHNCPILQGSQGYFEIGPQTLTHNFTSFDDAFSDCPKFDGTGVEYLSILGAKHVTRMFGGATLKPDMKLDTIIRDLNNPNVYFNPDGLDNIEIHLESMFKDATWWATGKPFAALDYDRKAYEGQYEREVFYNLHMNFMFNNFTGSLIGTGIEDAKVKTNLNNVSNMFKNCNGMEDECIDLSHWEVENIAPGYFWTCTCCTEPNG